MINTLRPRRGVIESRLLFLATVYFLTGLILVCIISPGVFTRHAAVAAVVVAGGFALVRRAGRPQGFSPDPLLLPVTAVLTGTGIVFLFRLDVSYGLHQLVCLLVALAALLLVNFLPRKPHIFCSRKEILVAAGAAFLLLPVFFGSEVGGAYSWLDFGLFYLQPSEFVKILLVLILAAYLSKMESGERNLKNWMPFWAMWLIFPGLLVVQNDLGMAMIYFVTLGALFYVASGNYWYIPAGAGILSLAGTGGYLLFPHVAPRVEVWLNPWQPELATGAAYQVIQSLTAVKAGGVLGLGLGAGNPGSIPAVHTDFIYAAICEELGLAGGAGIVLLYMVLVYRGFYIALRARSTFHSLAATGLTVMLGCQVFIILAGVIKIIPLTGITLPFISYGGSSLVANYISLALLMNISHAVTTDE